MKFSRVQWSTPGSRPLPPISESPLPSFTSGANPEASQRTAGRPTRLTGLPKSSRPRGMSKSFHGFAKKRTVFLPQPQSRQRRDQKFIRSHSKTGQRVFGSSAGRISKLFRRRGDLLQRQPKNSAGMGGLEIGGRILSQLRAKKVISTTHDLAR